MSDGGEAAAVPEAPVEPAAPGVSGGVTSHTETAGLLSSAAVEPSGASDSETPIESPAEPPPAEAASDGGATPPEGGRPPDSAEPPEVAHEPPEPEPIAYEYTLPEEFRRDDERLGRLTEIVAPHRLPAEAAQQLLDLHVEDVRAVTEHVASEQHRIFAETRAEWRRQITEDAELGGAGFETNRAKAVRMMQMFVPEGRREAFDQALLATGMTDHPEFFRFLVNLARKFDEPPPPPPNPSPPPNAGRRPGGLRGALYDHPRSRPGG